MRRRQFLHHTCGSALAAGLALGGPRAWALPGTTDARLLIVFLRGAYDALSLLVPAERSFYAEARPTIAIGATQALALTADWGLHPAMASSLGPLVQRGEACFVPFAGTHNTSRSHFETQDSIELGLPGGVGEAAGRDLRSGFLNRLAVQLGGAPALAFTDQLPLVLRGQQPVGNVSLRSPPGRSGDSAAQAAAVQAMYRQTALQPSVDAAYALREQVARQVAEEAVPGLSREAARDMAASGRNAVSARGFELEARRIGRMMREECRLGFIDVGGWDTHVNQGAATGALASRFEELARGLASLPDALGAEAWRRTTVVVLSEFGRTARENGNRGTDHGHGTVYTVLGGALAAGPAVRGAQVPVAAAHLHQGRDLPVLNDYRGLLAGLMARQFGLGTPALDAVFAGVQPLELGLL